MPGFQNKRIQSKYKTFLARLTGWALSVRHFFSIIKKERFRHLLMLKAPFFKKLMLKSCFQWGAAPRKSRKRDRKAYSCYLTIFLESHTTRQEPPIARRILDIQPPLPIPSRFPRKPPTTPPIMPRIAFWKKLFGFPFMILLATAPDKAPITSDASRRSSMSFHPFLPEVYFGSPANAFLSMHYKGKQRFCQ